jgi:hypothetical protein
VDELPTIEQIMSRVEVIRSMAFEHVNSPRKKELIITFSSSLKKPGAHVM